MSINDLLIKDFLKIVAGDVKALCLNPADCENQHKALCSL